MSPYLQDDRLSFWRSSVFVFGADGASMLLSRPRSILEIQSLTKERKCRQEAERLESVSLWKTAMTELGPTDLGPDRVRPDRVWPRPS